MILGGLPEDPAISGRSALGARPQRTERGAMGTGLRALSTAECLQRLVLGGVGRVSVTEHALPIILPVLFVCDGDSVLFGTARGGLLARTCHEAVIAFEASDVSAATGAGWSVLVVGVSSVLPGAGTVGATAPGQLDHAGSDPDLLVRLRMGRITGQQGQVGRPRAGPWPSMAV